MPGQSGRLGHQAVSRLINGVLTAFRADPSRRDLASHSRPTRPLAGPPCRARFPCAGAGLQCTRTWVGAIRRASGQRVVTRSPAGWRCLVPWLPVVACRLPAPSAARPSTWFLAITGWPISMTLTARCASARFVPPGTAPRFTRRCAGRPGRRPGHRLTVRRWPAAMGGRRGRR
jgi:hypothetical protein